MKEDKRTTETKKTTEVAGLNERLVERLVMREICFEMSNFDHTIDDGMADALMAEPGKVLGRHSAWNFNGEVYFSHGKYHENVWRYGSHIATISADTLKDLMADVNSKYGSD